MIIRAKVVSKNSLVFILYIFMFSLFKVFWENLDVSSTTTILGACASFLLISSFIFSENKIHKPLFLAIGFILLNLIYFLINYAFSSNDGLFIERLYEFIIFGIIPVILLAQVRDLDRVFKCYVIFSIVLFILFAIDPFLNYKYSGNYMDYGYQMMLPVFFGTHLGRTLYGWKFLGILQLIAFILILVFGNRMASIACVFFYLMLDLLYFDFTFRKRIKYLFLVFSFSGLVLFFKDILAWIANVLEDFNLSSYSLRTLLNFSDLRSFSAGRDLIWDRAIVMFLEKPIFGHGIGVFQKTYGTYPHNIILELLTNFGLIGLLLYLILILYSANRILRADYNIRLLGIIFFCTAFPKLFTSIYFFKEPSFWLFIFLGFFAPLLQLQNLKRYE